MHAAAFMGQTETAEMLIANGADMEAKAEGGGTPLVAAAERGHLETAKLLIARGADVNAKVSNGATPLDVARVRGHTHVASLLESHGGIASGLVECARPGCGSSVIALLMLLLMGCIASVTAGMIWPL